MCAVETAQSEGFLKTHANITLKLHVLRGILTLQQQLTDVLLTAAKTQFTDLMLCMFCMNDIVIFLLCVRKMGENGHIKVCFAVTVCVCIIWFSAAGIQMK